MKLWISVLQRVLVGCYRRRLFYCQKDDRRIFQAEQACRAIIFSKTLVEAPVQAMADNKYCVDYAKRVCKCQKCKQSIGKKEARVGKIVPNPFSEDGGEMKQYFHINCMFDSLLRARKTTKKIEDPSDLEGFSLMEEEDKETIRRHIQELEDKKTTSSPGKGTPRKRAAATLVSGDQLKKPVTSRSPPNKTDGVPLTASPAKVLPKALESDDDRTNSSFRDLRKLCFQIAEESSYLAKTKIVAEYIEKGSDQGVYKGELYILVKLLLPGIQKRVYNLHNKQLIKLFSQIFQCSLDQMMTDLEQGDVSETICKFFEHSKALMPQKKSKLTMHQVDNFLERLSFLTKEDEQESELTRITRKCTANDLKMIVRLIKHDLRMNAGAKHVLDALDPNAYEAFQASRNLKDVVDRVLESRSSGSKKLAIKLELMTPILPMLAEPCKSVDYAMKKCPNGMYAEIKYDGERVQVHKKGNCFEFYSRSLKPVLSHKVSHFQQFFPQACLHAQDLILDSEVLLVDNKTGKPLPFGTLGIHKKAAFKDASVCLFVFDCIHFNGQTLMDKPLWERKKILHKNMTEVKNKIKLSEGRIITTPEELAKEIQKAIREGLEGLVLKDRMSIYEPGKRHWLKVKKDYLGDKSMADSADLVVLGAYYGTGSKGGMMSVFLMGVEDRVKGKWMTVTKVGNGHDDATIDQINRELEVVKIGKDPTQVPPWLHVNRTLVPDFVVKDPKRAPVWEVTGAEFSRAEKHTADGISIRFPRVTRIRADKSWQEATDLTHLKTLFTASKQTLDLVNDDAEDDDGEDDDDNNDDNNIIDGENGGGRTGGQTFAPDIAAGGNKRKFKDIGDISTTSETFTKKPPCKYGIRCYQKDPNHLESFFHPSTTQPKILADIFTGMNFYVTPGLSDGDRLRRYIVAYDGELVSDYDMDSASHHVVSPENGTDPNSTAVKVTAKWIWDCIKSRGILPMQE